MKTAFKIILPALVIAVTTVSCDDEPVVIEKKNYIETKIITVEDTTEKFTRIEGDAHSGKGFSRADSVNRYGTGITYNIHDSLIGKDLRLNINMWARSGNPGNHVFAVALHEGDNIKHWAQIDLKNHIAELNKWTNVIDSLSIPGTAISNKGMVLKIYSLNPDGISNLDTDDIEIKFNSVTKFIDE